MNQKLKTSIAFAKNLLVTGAISETSRQVEIDICKHISKEDHKIIVEFGMGHGNITQEILNTISPTSKLYAFEVKESFCDHVRKNILDDRLVIVNDGAQNLKKHIKENVNGVISSIPFSFFSKEKGLAIIQDAYDLLENNAYYSQVLYTKFNFKKFQQIFEACEITSNKNFITEYIYHCKKVRK
ncbi:class I SAM-dependent methyltransferase [Flavivirga sp. 57AJ16]|uniref:class I SAM-dependent methyltransferase n=1 Tax=Flavivirga sp. 57AJ16 TaxID=3025307 RepID=UPI0023660FA9|nr:methyltransferase [Flavivirga sp. 57AJ16]MDD7884666.1 methyltransferase [Flavivirga sp. 57AJ16]